MVKSVKYVYPSMIVLSILSNIILVVFLSRKFKYKKYELVSMLMADVLGVVAGGILYTRILFGGFGFSSLGGVLGSLLFLYVYSLITKKDFKYIMILFMPSIPLMYAIGKIGCFVAGCCHGIEYSGLLSIMYSNSLVAPNGINLFPVQIIETIVFLIIFIFIIFKYLKSKMSIRLVMFEMILCGIFKFVLDFFRYSHNGKIVSANQIMCLVIIVVGIIYLIRVKKKIKE